MTERDADADQGDEREPALPPDEEAAWAEIVAAYGETYGETAAEDTDGREPDGDTLTEGEGTSGDGDDDGSERGDEHGNEHGDDGDSEGHGEGRQDPPVRSFTVYAAGGGPRDWQAREEGDSENHFVPPEPPPLPATDPTTRFAWLAALGGPLLLFGAVLVRADMTWWIMTLGIGGFLGGFATLVARMRDGRDDDDYDDPGRGAVV